MLSKFSVASAPSPLYEAYCLFPPSSIYDISNRERREVRKGMVRIDYTAFNNITPFIAHIKSRNLPISISIRTIGSTCSWSIISITSYIERFNPSYYVIFRGSCKDKCNNMQQSGAEGCCNSSKHTNVDRPHM